jgi:hypothetical protein
LRSESEKWKVPESDPAGRAPADRVEIPDGPGPSSTSGEAGDRGPLVFCGMCGALNPSTSYYCAACGSTLVDAFHATEGLRVWERPDVASRIIDIVPAGSELDVNEDPDAPGDYVRVRLANGRLGYIRLAEVGALTASPREAAPQSRPDINTNARGCVSPFAALASLALLILLSSLSLYLLNSSESDQGQFLALLTCLIVAPVALLMIFLYLMARDREDRRLADEEDLAREREAARQ